MRRDQWFSRADELVQSEFKSIHRLGSPRTASQIDRKSQPYTWISMPEDMKNVRPLRHHLKLGA